MSTQLSHLSLSLILAALPVVACVHPETASEEEAATSESDVATGHGQEVFLPACIATTPTPQLGDCRATVRAYQRFCTAALGGDEQMLPTLLADDLVTSTISQNLPWSGTFVGATGFFEFFGRVTTHQTVLNFQVDQFVCNPSNPSRVLVIFKERLQSPATGKEFLSEIVSEIGVNSRGQLNKFKIWEDTMSVQSMITP
jgi:hypothetical protein